MIDHKESTALSTDNTTQKALMEAMKSYKRRARLGMHGLRDACDTYLMPKSRPAQTTLGFAITGGSSQHHRAMQRGLFERTEVTWLKSELSRAEIFVDIGANIGYFSCLARTLRKRVLAVEPMPYNVQHLLRNVHINDGPVAEIHPVALADRVGVLKLHGASSTGASLVPDWAGASSRFARLVPVTTLDNLLCGRFDEMQLVVKMDVEGSEFKALTGAQSTLLRSKKPTWLVEITMGEFMPGGYNPDFVKTFDLFWSQGYRSSLLTANGEVSLTRSDIERYQARGRSDFSEINYVFRPGEA